MIALLRALHAMAAQRGDGLREELQRTSTPSAAWSDGLGAREAIKRDELSQRTDQNPGVGSLSTKLVKS